jgi:hypothetical protein
MMVLDMRLEINRFEMAFLQVGRSSENLQTLGDTSTSFGVVRNILLTGGVLEVVVLYGVFKEINGFGDIERESKVSQ